MRKVFLSSLLVLAGLQLLSQKSAVVPDYKNELRVGIFQFFTGTLNVSYEHYFKPASSIVIEGNLTLIRDNEEDVIGGKGEMQYRFYVRPSSTVKNASRLEGIFVGPYVGYHYYDITDHNYYVAGSYYPIDKDVYYSTIMGGFIAGVKYTILERFTVDAYLGGGLRSTDTDDDYNQNNNIFERGYTGISPRVNLTFGIRF